MTVPGCSATRWTCRMPLLSLLLCLTVLIYTPTPARAIEFKGFSNTYARYPVWNACHNSALKFQFKTRQPSAMLVYTDDNGRYDFLQLALAKGAVKLFITFDTQENRFVDVQANTKPLNDDQWHEVEIRRNRMETILFVDEVQTSKVALGAESDSLEKERTNNVYFGGIPTGYNKKLPDKFTNERFRGELRNILYFNCSCIPARAPMVDGQGVSTDKKEACEVRDNCPAECPCVSGDDVSGCECRYKRDCLKQLHASYELPMDEVQDGTLINFSGLDSVVEGYPRLVPGVRNNALLLDGSSQWLRVTGANHRRECMGDLSKCPDGYYMGMWLQFRDVRSNQPGIYLSNGGHSSRGHGVAIRYRNGLLEMIFKMPDGKRWRAETADVVDGHWYHVAASWTKDKGLYLFINGELKAHDRTSSSSPAANGNFRYNAFYIGRANDNTGTDYLGNVLVDEFKFVADFKNETEVRELGPIVHYYQSLDKIQNSKVKGSPDGFEGRVYRAASPVEGKIGQAILLSGNDEYLDLGETKDSCLGDLDLCPYGLYVSLWVLFNRVDPQRKAILTSPAFGLYQDGTRLVAVAKTQRQYWETYGSGLAVGQWYFVEMSWKPGDGISLYMNRQRVNHQSSPSNRAPESLRSSNMYMGWDTARGSTYPAATLDELNIYYADRDTLADIDFIKTVRPLNIHFDMDALERGRLVHDSLVVTALGSPRVVQGKVGYAIFMDGVRDALDFGDRTDSCFGNLDLCRHGMLLSFWLRPEQLSNGVSFLSSGTSGMDIVYEAGKLKVKANTARYSWEVSTSDFDPKKWHFLEVSYHPTRGLQLYRNGNLVAESSRPRVKDTPIPARYGDDRFYLGRSNSGRNSFSSGAFDELDVWYADRTYLTSQGFIQRSRPDSIKVHFEEINQERTRVVHPNLDIQLTGRPGLSVGKIGYALSLNGQDQYADLGMHSHSCMGNLAHCQQGITVSAWMRFRRFENNMVFLSTGETGLLLLFQDGYVLASADGRDQVSAPRFDVNRWYHVELTWHPNHGLKMYVDNREVEGDSIPHTYRAPQSDSGHFYIGRPNYGDLPSGSYVTGNFDIDELEVWYLRREDLLAFGYIDRAGPWADELGCENFPMDQSRGDTVLSLNHELTLKSGASLGPGRKGKSLQLNGLGQYLDMGYQMDNCMGNLDLCPHGFTLSVWLRPNALSENMHFLAAPSYFLFYEESQLSAEFNSRGRSWIVSTPNFRTGAWQRVTLAWHEIKGLRMYLDDQLVDHSMGEQRPDRNTEPASGNLYVGRNLVDTRMTADAEIDELQICNDDLDQLIATGAYQIEVFPIVIKFHTLRDGTVFLGNRRISAIGNVNLREGLLRDTMAVYLNGLNQYLDFGDNFTCKGNLESCTRGLTFRMSVNPVSLREGMYLLDSFPVSLYYKNGRLTGTLRTLDQEWTVDTPDLKEGQWSRVEMSWHPTRGLALYVNGDRMDYQIYPDRRNPEPPSSWNTYLGRPLQLKDGTYSNAYVDNVEFYNAYRNVIDMDSYLEPLNRYLYQLNSRPATTIRPQFTRPPSVTSAPVTRPSSWAPWPETGDGTTRIIRLNGRAWVHFDFNQLPPEYLTRTDLGDLSIMFLSDRPDGLIWYQEEPARVMYLTMKDGRLEFVHDDKTGSPDKVVIGQRDNARFDDYRWHRLLIDRNRRRVEVTVDDKYKETYTFPDDIQFLAPSHVWLGGIPDTSAKTKGYMTDNFIGGMANVVYRTNRAEGSRIIRNEVNLISQVDRGDITGNVIIEGIPDGSEVTTQRPNPSLTTRPPPVTEPPRRRTTSITVIRDGVLFKDRALTLRSGSSLTYSFKTLNPTGLMLYSGVADGVYFAVELVDGRLYFVNDFGGGDRRTAFSGKSVADGQLHEVEVRFYPTHVDLRVDNIRQRVDLNQAAGEKMPSGMGTLYVTGLPDDNKGLPWRVWSREGYIGCFNDLRVDSRLIDFEPWLDFLVGRVTRGCMAVSQQCALTRPCTNGQCRNTMISHVCDCSMTAFRGPYCRLDAWSALFNGSIIAHLDFSSTLKSHSDDLSVRFLTPARDGLLFQTFAKASNDFLRASMENGRVKVETNLGGVVKTMYASSDNLPMNDMQWHTLYIQRRGNEMEAWVDNSPHAKETLAGDGYYLNIDRLHLGGLEGQDKRYIGYLQNFYLGSRDVLQDLRGTKLGVDSFPNLPPLVYYGVTFPDLDSFVSLQPLDKPEELMLQFMFKTKEPSGILLLASGRNQGYLVVELFEGNLFIQFSADSGQPLRARSAQKVNDDRWHRVTIQRVAGDQRQFLLTVDGVPSSVSYGGRDNLILDGPVYIGGVPDVILQKGYIKNGVFSRTGFRGCLASMDLSGKVTDLATLAKAQGVSIYDSCRPIVSRACTSESCKNFGKCLEVGANTFMCDCKMSAHSGAVCLDEPIGFRYQNFSRPGKEESGILEYSFPTLSSKGTSTDEIAFGVMTKQDNAVLLRVFSETFKDYIEFRLRNGFVEASYDTEGKGGRHTVTELTQKVNDGKSYHIVRFIRTPEKATLHVDKATAVNKHSSAHGNFDGMSKIYIGGIFDAQKKIIDGFDGILGGLHINGLLVFPQARNKEHTEYMGDVVLAPRPFNLTSYYDGGTVVLPGPTTTLTPPTVATLPPVVGPTRVPPAVGGGGVSWVPGNGGAGISVYPGGDEGTGGVVPGGGSATSPAVAGMVGGRGTLSGAGPRAGAVVGTILGVLVFLMALMWAFVRCKPGWSACLKPPAEAVVSAPLLSASNKGAVVAAGGGVTAAGGTITGMGEGAGLNGAGGNAFTNYYISSANASGAGGGEQFDTATLRATGTFSNKGTAIGTTQSRVYLGSTGTAASSGYHQQESIPLQPMGTMDRMDGGPALSPVSMQSYHYEGAGESTTADYDLVTGIHPGYQTATMSTRGGSVSGGSFGGGGLYPPSRGPASVSGSIGGYNTNTLQSNYNYSVRNLGSVSGHKQISGYMDSNVVGIPPGALGEEVRVDCCLMSEDGHSVVTGSSLGPPQVWDMQTGELLRIMQGDTVGSTYLHLACNGGLLVGAINADLEANQFSVPKGVNNYFLQIWDFHSGRAMGMSDKEVCSALQMMKDKEKVVLARTDKFGSSTTLVVWDLLGNEAFRVMHHDAPVGNNDFVHFLALSQNNRYAILGFSNSIDNMAEFIVMDMTLPSNTPADSAILRIDAIPECTAVLPRDEAVTGMRNGELVIWSMRTGQPSRQLVSGSGRHAHTHEVKAVCVSEDSRYMVSASADGTVKVWDMSSERLHHTFNGHTDEVWCCDISADNEIVVSGSRDRTIRLWKMRDGSNICTFNAGVDIFHINMSRDKATIVGLGDKLGARKLVMLQVVRTKVRRQLDD